MVVSSTLVFLEHNYKHLHYRVAIFESSFYLQIMFYTKVVGMLIIYLRIKFHSPGINGSLVIAIKQNVNSVLYNAI
jgi:hypothetical protein